MVAERAAYLSRKMRSGDDEGEKKATRQPKEKRSAGFLRCKDRRELAWKGTSVVGMSTLFGAWLPQEHHHAIAASSGRDDGAKVPAEASENSARQTLFIKPRMDNNIMRLGWQSLRVASTAWPALACWSLVVFLATNSSASFRAPFSLLSSSSAPRPAQSSPGSDFQPLPLRHYAVDPFSFFLFFHSTTMRITEGVECLQTRLVPTRRSIESLSVSGWDQIGLIKSHDTTTCAEIYRLTLHGGSLDDGAAEGSNKKRKRGRENEKWNPFVNVDAVSQPFKKKLERYRSIAKDLGYLSSTRYRSALLTITARGTALASS